MTEGNTDQKEAAEATASRFLEALYDDPLRAETMRTARYLVVTSAICTAVVLFKVNLKSSILNPQVH